MMMTVEAIQSFHTNNISYVVLTTIQDFIHTHIYICIKNAQPILGYII